MNTGDKIETTDKSQTQELYGGMVPAESGTEKTILSGQTADGQIHYRVDVLDKAKKPDSKQLVLYTLPIGENLATFTIHGTALQLDDFEVLGEFVTFAKKQLARSTQPKSIDPATSSRSSAPPTSQSSSRKWLESYAHGLGLSYAVLMAAAADYRLNRKMLTRSGLSNYEIAPLFWVHYAVVTGEAALATSSFLACELIRRIHLPQLVYSSITQETAINQHNGHHTRHH